MDERAVDDVCRLCGMHKKLSFEHIPPKASGNDRRARLVNGLDVIRSNRTLWSLEGLRYVNSQQGSGKYCLCEECNSFLGSEYVRDFLSLYNQIPNIHKDTIEGYQQKAVIEISGVDTLKVMKYLFGAFLCINEASWGERNSSIRDFVADPGSLSIDTRKYALNAFFRVDSLQKTVYRSESHLFYGRHMIVSSIDFPKIGFTLSIDDKSQEINLGTFLVSLAGKVVDIQLDLPCYEANSIFPLDFRSRDAIVVESIPDKDKNRNKKITLLSFQELTDFEIYVALAIDGLNIEKVRVIANTEEQAVLKRSIGRELLMSLYFDVQSMSRIQGPLQEITSDKVIGRVERIALMDKIELNCGVVLVADFFKGFPTDLKPGDYLSLEGFFSAMLEEECVRDE